MKTPLIRSAFARAFAAIALTVVSISAAHAQFFQTTYINGRPYSATNYYGYVDLAPTLGSSWRYVGTGFRPNYVGYSNSYHGTVGAAASALGSGGYPFISTAGSGGCISAWNCHPSLLHGPIQIQPEDLPNLMWELLDQYEPYDPAKAVPPIDVTGSLASDSIKPELYPDAPLPPGPQ